MSDEETAQRDSKDHKFAQMIQQAVQQAVEATHVETNKQMERWKSEYLAEQHYRRFEELKETFTGVANMTQTLVKTAKDLPDKDPNYESMVDKLREEYKTSRWHQQRDKHEVKFTLELFDWFYDQKEMGQDLELPEFVCKRIKMQYVVCMHGWPTAIKMERRESGLDVGLKIPSPDHMQQRTWTDTKPTTKKVMAKKCGGWIKI